MEFFNKLSKNEIYIRLFKTPFSYSTGAVLLGIFATAHLAVLGSAWGVTGPFTVWGAKFFNLIGIDTTQWAYFIARKSMLKAIETPILQHGGSIRNIGLIVGALLATLLASEFKIKKIKNMKQLLWAMFGGFLMGVGARLANGCNVGALFSGLAAMSLSGWIFAISLIIGSFIGCKILLNFILTE